MTRQLDLFGFEQPRFPARRGDPQTSHEAAKDLVKSGRASHLQKEAAEIVGKHPGKTGRELSVICGWDIWKRLKEAEEKGYVYRGPERRCSVSGFNAVTWFRK